MDVTTHVESHIAADTVSSMFLNFGVNNVSLISSALISITFSSSPRSKLMRTLSAGLIIDSEPLF